MQKKKSTSFKRLTRYNIPWYNNTIKHKLKERDKMYKKMKEFSYVLEYKENFRILKNKVNLLIQKFKKLYMSRKFETAGNNSKKTWQVINEIHRKKVSQISPLNLTTIVKKYQSQLI